MSSSLQTILALGLVALAAVFLLRSWFSRKKKSTCGGACGSVNPEIKELQSKLKQRAGL
jgi:hypothetical protein